MYHDKSFIFSQTDRNFKKKFSILIRDIYVHISIKYYGKMSMNRTVRLVWIESFNIAIYQLKSSVSSVLNELFYKISIWYHLQNLWSHSLRHLLQFRYILQKFVWFSSSRNGQDICWRQNAYSNGARTVIGIQRAICAKYPDKRWKLLSVRDICKRFDDTKSRNVAELKEMLKSKDIWNKLSVNWICHSVLDVQKRLQACVDILNICRVSRP